MGLMSELSFVPAEKPNEATAAIMPKTDVTEKEQPAVKAKPVEKEKPAEVKVVKTKPVKEKNVTKAKEVTETKEAIVKKEPETKTAPEVKQKQAAADINSRVIETIQSVNYSSDSLVISLYDNGEVDGDTVSVLMNGNVIMPMVGLTTNAVRKTINTKDITHSIQIVMYAENLGRMQRHKAA